MFSIAQTFDSFNDNGDEAPKLERDRRNDPLLECSRDALATQMSLNIAFVKIELAPVDEHVVSYFVQDMFVKLVLADIRSVRLFCDSWNRMRCRIMMLDRG